MPLEKGFLEISEIKDLKIQNRFRHFSHLNHQIEICEYTALQVFLILEYFDEKRLIFYEEEKDNGLYRHIINYIELNGNINEIKFFLKCKFDPFFLSEKRFGSLEEIQDLEIKAKFNKFMDINNRVEKFGITFEEINEIINIICLFIHDKNLIGEKNYHLEESGEFKSKYIKLLPEFIDHKNNGLYLKILKYITEGGNGIDLDDFWSYKFGLD